MIIDQRFGCIVHEADLDSCPPIVATEFVLFCKGKAQTQIVAELYHKYMILRYTISGISTNFRVDFDFQLSFEFLRKNIQDKEKYSLEEVYAIRFLKENQHLELRCAKDREVLGLWREQLGLQLNQRGFHELFHSIQQIGSGAFASVYLVRSLEEGKHYAVKAFPKESVYAQQQGVRSIVNEIEIMRSLKHKNLMSMKGVYESKNSIYICVELLSGGRLHDRIKNRYKFASQEVRLIMKGILQGLQAMHQLNYMHRDIKPENILFRESGKNQCVIADFGLAESASSQQLMFPRCGTPGYVAPQIANLKSSSGVAYSTTCDLFSLGVIFHMMILGRSPFSGLTNDEVMQQNKNCKFNFQKFEYNQLPSTWLSLLRGLLEKDPTKRLTATQALAHEFFKKEPLITRNIDKPTFKSSEDSPKLRKGSFECESPLMLTKNSKRKTGVLRQDSCLKFKMRETVMAGKAEQGKENIEMSPMAREKKEGKYGESRFKQMAEKNS